MRDPNLVLLLSGALLVFLAIALYSHRGLALFARRTRVPPPHPALVLVLRLWFGALALGCFVLLLRPLLHR